MKISVKLKKLHVGQQNILKNKRRFNVVACGRRWGKSLYGSQIIVEDVLKGQRDAYLAPTYRMTMDFFRNTSAILGKAVKRKNFQEKFIETISGGVVDIFSLTDIDAPRGRAYHRVVIDEAALIKNLKQAWSESIRPTLTDYRGDAFLLSTPKGFNDFYDLYDRDRQSKYQNWRSFNAPTTSNPYISKEEIEEARLETVEWVFNQEYLAQFVDSQSGIFKNILDLTDAIEQLKGVEDRRYVIGADWAKRGDYSAFVVVDCEARAVVSVTRLRDMDYTYQIEVLKALVKDFNNALIVAERNSMGDVLIEQLRKNNLDVRDFVTTNKSKTEAIEKLALAFERKQIKIIPDPDLVSELQSFGFNKTPSGMVKYEARTGHDDLVMSLAFAWSEIEPSSVLMGFS